MKDLRFAGMEGLMYDDLGWERRAAQFSGMGVYGVSKFANLMWAFALQRRYESKGIVVVRIPLHLAPLRFTDADACVAGVTPPRSGS